MELDKEIEVMQVQISRNMTKISNKWRIITREDSYNDNNVEKLRKNSKFSVT